ncbi:metallophosphoesterase [Brachybacterium sp. YJGR34]|uniref:metallophosphoesterase n=1 Tax=Brachybacterium sp. YJGR34 TaxID=2059911 RepID=UPI000E0A6059|nr:metallophosphoesterase [Brachybacterium sp. YJGR34]
MTAPLAVAPRSPGTGGAGHRRLAVLALAALLVLAPATGWLLWDNRRLDVTTYEVTVADLPPSADGLRIAQLSDLHSASFGTFPERLVDDVRSARPDLIALSGDLIDHRTTDLGGVLDIVSALQKIAPCYVVLGNHEAASPLQAELIDALEDRGAVVLRDEARTVRAGGTELTIAGLDDPQVASWGAERSPRSVLGGMDLPPGVPTILLAHRPELLESYSGRGIDLVLSGHAHGGQVRLPLLGGVFAPHQGIFPELTEGVHVRGDTTMVISRGLGNSVAGVRVNNPRELVLVDLRAGV